MGNISVQVELLTLHYTHWRRTNGRTMEQLFKGF